MIKNRKIEGNFELIFKIVYLLFVLLSFNSFCARHSYISYLSYAVVVFAGIIVVNRLTHLKDYKNIRVWLLVAFVISYFISSINTIKYGFLENAQAMVWMCIQFFIVFAFDMLKDREQVDKEFNIIAIVFILYTMIMAIIALMMMQKGYSKNEIVDNYYYIYAGFLFNRLWGCYTDPNYGAVLSMLSILFSCFFFKKSNVVLRIVLVINIVLEYLFITYSDSRTGEMAILLSVAVLVFELLIKNKRISKRVFFRVIIVAIIAVAIACTTWYGTHIVQKITSDIKVANVKQVEIEHGATEYDAELVADYSRIGRMDVQINGGDISNNRVDIWKYGLNVFKQNPIIGISFRNIMEYSMDVMPEEYVGFESMHNFIVDILVSQGIVGIGIIFILVVLILIQMFKKVPKLENEDYRLFAYAFSSILAIMASMLTYSETFYMNTAGAFLFWYLLGLITNYLLVDRTEIKEN